MQKHCDEVVNKLAATSSKSTIQNLVSANVAFLRQGTSLHIVLTPDKELVRMNKHYIQRALTSNTSSFLTSQKPAYIECSFFFL